MRSLLDQLESSEAVLLMYLADELPAADREEIDKRLAADASLRAELETLRTAQDAMAGAMASLDAAQPLPMPSAAAQRQLCRTVRQWQAEQFARNGNGQTEAARGPAWLQMLYPIGAAAVLLIGVIIWWGTRTDESTLVAGGDPAPFLDGRPGRDFSEFRRNFYPHPSLDAPVEAVGLADMERELATLQYLRELSDESAAFAPASPGEETVN